MRKTVSVCLLLLFLSTFIFAEIPVYADEAVGGTEIKTQSINPGSFYYSFKRIWEKFSERMVLNAQSKVNLHESLLKTRLEELNYVIEKRLLSEIQTSSERFAYQAGILTGEVIKVNKDKEAIVKKFDQYSKVLEKLRDNFPANSSFWMLVQHDINSLSILSATLK